MPQNPPAIDSKPAGTKFEERKMPQVSGNRTGLHAAGVVPFGGGDLEGMPECPTNAAGSSLLLASLQRLYVSNDGESNDGRASHPTNVPLARRSTSPLGNQEYDLSASLLEAVFEISDFDPLPQLSQSDENFARTDFGPRDATPALRANHHRHGAPVQPSGQTSAWPHERAEASRPIPAAAAGSDRRKLPRRESECQLAVYRCTTEERLTADRIAWLLHATQLKGTLIDVSMSGISFCLTEPLAADAKILLRIKNRTIDEHVDTTAVVLRSREAAEGDWNVVCRFSKNLTFEQIHMVGRSLFAATIV
jgi:hypothetical protein